jgi:hypothetical protein
MPDVVKHAWTHRPRSEGGTDPIEIPAASDLLWVTASASTEAVPQTSGTYYPFGLDFIYTNGSGDFEAADITSGRAAYLQINTPGYYVLQAQIFKAAGTFASTNHTWIEPAVEIGGSRGNIVGNEGVADFMGAFWTAGSSIIVGGEGREGLYTTLAFNYDPDNPVSNLDAENPLKVGLNLAQSAGPSSISMAGSIFLYRIASAGYTDISPP